MELSVNNRPRAAKFMSGAAQFIVARPELLQNPLWYVVIVAGLAGLTYFLGFLWWLTLLVAAGWGLWLLWLFFAPGEAGPNREEPLAVYLAQAQLYRGKITQLLQAAPTENSYDHRQQLAAQVERWTGAIQALVERIAGLRQHTLLQNDLAAVPQAIAALTTQLAAQADPELRRQLHHTLASRQNQLAALELLQNTITQAEIQLENTIALLGTIYSQLLTSQSTHHVADYGRFLAEIDEEMHCLQDRLEALREVKGGHW
jgi:hypothetical protein